MLVCLHFLPNRNFLIVIVLFDAVVLIQCLFALRPGFLATTRNGVFFVFGVLRHAAEATEAFVFVCFFGLYRLCLRLTTLGLVCRLYLALILALPVLS